MATRNQPPPPPQTRERDAGDPASRNGRPYHQDAREMVKSILDHGGWTRANWIGKKQVMKFPS